MTTRMQKRLIPLLIGIFFSFSSFANGEDTAKTAATDSVKNAERDTFVLAEDDPIVAAMDSFLLSMYSERDTFISDTAQLNTSSYPADSVPVYPDSVYEARLKALDKRTPMDIEHNSVVQAYVDLYSTRRRELTSRLLGLSEVYFPMIEQKLDKHGIPLEMKYLAIVESALNPTARSRAGATGLWQFMYRTGKLYGLDITSYVDERMDPELSTEAACEYLNFLHGMYGDWFLVLAAYNAGPGNVNRALRRAGGGKMSYWDLRPFLPRETRGYVPAFVAVNYVMNYHKEHNLYPVPPKFRHFEFDTVHVKKELSFAKVHRTMDVPIKTLEFLNPIYKKKEIPAVDGYNVLKLPREKIGVFLANEDSIYKEEEKPEVVNGYITKRETEIHRVRSGQYLGAIANRYGCTIRDIMHWNNLRSTRIQPGQRLVIHKTVKEKVTEENKDDVAQEATEKKNEEAQEDYQYYTVQRGDTLWDIARKYSGVTVRELQQLNGHSNVRRLKPGQKIKIQVDG